MSRIAAVVFDLDGVLIDATEWHYEALNRALALFGYTISRYEHLAAYNGLPTRKKLEMLTTEKGLPESLHDLLVRLKQRYTTDEIVTKCRPTFDKEYMLSRLKRDGYRLAVCSNAVRDSVALMLRQAGLIDYFEFVLSNEDVSRPKPDSEVYCKALRRLGIEAAELAVVEDAHYGVQAALGATPNVCQVSGVHDVDYFRVRGFIDAADRRGVTA